jgi:hypothetical protein
MHNFVQLIPPKVQCHSEQNTTVRRDYAVMNVTGLSISIVLEFRQMLPHQQVTIEITQKYKRCHFGFALNK